MILMVTLMRRRSSAFSQGGDNHDDNGEYENFVDYLKFRQPRTMNMTMVINSSSGA